MQIDSSKSSMTNIHRSNQRNEVETDLTISHTESNTVISHRRVWGFIPGITGKLITLLMFSGLLEETISVSKSWVR